MLLNRVRLPLAAAVAGALLLTGWGEGDSGASEKSSEKSAAKVDLAGAEKTVTDYFAKFGAGDESACELESERFAKAEDDDFGGETCAKRVEALSEMFVELGMVEALESVSTTATEEADGRVAVAFELPADVGGGGTFLLVREGDGWLIDEEASDAESGDDPADGAGAAPTAQDEEWLAGWCEIELGTTREDLIATMGEPTAEGVDDDGQAELEWESDAVYLVAWLGEDDTVASTSAAGELDCD